MMKRPLCFTDFHVGLYSDSERHNQDCLDYMDWFITQFHEQRCDSVFFLGDWFHNREHVQWDTLWKSEQMIQRLDDLGVPVVWLLGNHDLWFNHNRSMHSHPALHRTKNIRLITELTQIDDMLFCPYLMGAEYVSVAKGNADYIFGHFNLTGFMVNENYEMTESDGGLNPDWFRPKALYSGHFHKRQQKLNANGTNVCYIGNAFPHNFNDAGDRERGCMVFDRDEPIFLNWDEAPTYDYANLSDVITYIEMDQISQMYGSRATINITNDIQLDDPDLSELRDWLRSQNLRTVRIEDPDPVEQTEEMPEITAPRENITEYFSAGLNQVDTEGSKYRLPLLQSLFKGAMEKHDRGEAV
jgi:DNA repair exonuclease SbcCD nuclease subunit